MAIRYSDLLKRTLVNVAFLMVVGSCNHAPPDRQHQHSVQQQEAGVRHREDRDRIDSLPDPRLTPGDTLAVTREDICTPGYTKKVRDVPTRLKNQVYQSYRRSREKGVCCEVDHLIPLELGGSNRPTNLWPEPYDIEWNARVKDRIESRLHKLVCSGDLDLATAQKAIAANWIEAYQKYGAAGRIPSHRKRQ